MREKDTDTPLFETPETTDEEFQVFKVKTVEILDSEDHRCIHCLQCYFVKPMPKRCVNR